MKNLSKCSEIRENTLVKRDYKALRSMTEPERKIEKLRRRKWLERTWHITAMIGMPIMEGYFRTSVLSRKADEIEIQLFEESMNKYKHNFSKN